MLKDYQSRKPILCLDFDGVCHSYTSKWQGPEVIPDPPVDGLADFLEDAIKLFDVQIFSTRSSMPGGTKAMRMWLWAHTNEEIVEAVKFPTKKPPAMVTLDDRAITFDGVFPEVEELLKFKPWNK